MSSLRAMRHLQPAKRWRDGNPGNGEGEGMYMVGTMAAKDGVTNLQAIRGEKAVQDAPC